jgi:urease accessory protein
MISIVEKILGNIDDPDWKIKLKNAEIDILNLDQWQAQKNRFRRKTENGFDLAVSLDRSSHLHDGDILVWEDDVRRAIITRIKLQDVMIIHLNELSSQPVEKLARTCLELGHALGNQHWPAIVKDSAVYVPLTVSQPVMSSVMKTHAFEGITYEFVEGSSVIPYLAPHESRRLFGAADSTPHSHHRSNGSSQEASQRHGNHHH